MKHLLLALLLICACSRVGQDKTTSTFPGEVFFSPKGGCTDAVIAAIAGAKKSVLCQAYELTAAPIGDALIEAKKRGVTVRVLVDKTQEAERTRSRAPNLLANGIEVKTDAKHHITHNKVLVIDEEVVVTGSFNFTPEAETDHAENLLVILDKGLAAKYAENWKKHEEHSRAYEHK